MPSNEWFLEGILHNKPPVLAELYRLFLPKVIAYIKNNSGSEEDAKDIFQEAVMVLFHKTRSGDIALSSTFQAYLLGVCRLLWLKQLGKNKSREVTFSDFPELPADDDLQEAIFRREQRRFYKKHLSSLSERCQKMMELFFQKMKMTDIAQAMGFDNENVAKKEKSKCQKRLVEKIQSDSDFTNFL